MSLGTNGIGLATAKAFVEKGAYVVLTGRGRRRIDAADRGYGQVRGDDAERPNLATIPEEQGVYQLFLDDQLVYIGKTDADAGPHKRLSRHARKVMHRVGLDPARVSFKAVRVFVFTAVDLKTDLIRHYGGVSSIDWNGSGFGSNDPDRERDTTKVKDNNFDAQFPSDIDRPFAFAIDQDETAASALARLKDALPYTFRYQGGRRRPHSDMTATLLNAKSGPMTPRDAVKEIVGKMPAGWQATTLPGYITLHKEKRIHPQAKVTWPSIASNPKPGNS